MMATLFDGAVVQGVGREPMPVHNVLIARCVGYVDGYGHTLAQAQQRAGNLAVVGDGLDIHPRGDLDSAVLDGQGVVRLGQRQFGGAFFAALSGCALLRRIEKAGGR